jgi:hypothetical protein
MVTIWIVIIVFVTGQDCGNKEEGGREKIGSHVVDDLWMNKDAKIKVEMEKVKNILT